MPNARKLVATLLFAQLAAGGCDARKAASTAPAGEEKEAAEAPVQAEPTTVTESTPTPGDTTTVAKPPSGADAARDAKNQADPSLAQRQSGILGGATGSGRGVGYAGPMAPPPAPGKHRRAPRPDMDGRALDPQGSEDYAHYDVNKMTLVEDDALSTFAVDVDTASYAIARRKILEGHAVPADAVRVEEFVNYFKYGYDGPADGRPFAVHMEAAPSPYGQGRHILRVGVQGKEVARRDRKPAHLVFLVDVSGSMSAPDKLPLAQRSLRILVDNLGENDTVALVTYAGSTRVVLPPTGMDKKAEIHQAIEDLRAGGSTAMASGMELAYGLALKQVKPGSETRVIVLSDGDANVGNTSHEEIGKQIAGYVKEGVTLSTIGFGMGNYKDRLMEQLANKGNGNNYYIDSLSQAKRVFQEQLGGTLEVIAQDVKLQVDFNPKAVKAYRLVGYENRDVADQDFRNDKVDAGEIGAGHAVTAVYEIELAAGMKDSHAPLATVRVRAKKPRAAEAAEYAYVFERAQLRPSFEQASASFRFATAVVGFAEILRKSPYADGWRLDLVLSIARGATPAGDEERSEFVGLVERVSKRKGS